MGSKEERDGHGVDEVSPAASAAFAGITLRGARVHNLQSVNVRIPRGKLTVFTGVSGSGKSSLAFDTLFAEAQRRYLESLPPYARQFLEKLERPALDFAEGLSPAVSIGQFASAAGPRSTLATVAELHDHLRLLFAHLGTPHCPHCGRVVRAVSPGALTERLLAEPAGTRITVLSPMVRGTAPAGGRGVAAVAEAARSGFVRVRLDAEVVPIESADAARAGAACLIDAVVDRIVIREGVRARVMDSVELAMRRSGGEIRLLVRRPGEAADTLVDESERLACPDCQIAFPVLTPSSFSFNSPAGACPACGGLGTAKGSETEPCPVCGGTRLTAEARACRLEVPGVEARNLPEVLALTVSDLRAWVARVAAALRPAQLAVAGNVLTGLGERLDFLVEAGLGYLCADRACSTLSGGEMRRVRLASALGQRLSGVLYVLDEPTAGLHPHDVEPLVRLLLRLRDAGNTLVVVEHNEAVIRAADHLVELGPGAGAAGGRITFCGPPEAAQAPGASLTGEFLAGRQHVSAAKPLPVGPDTAFLVVEKARVHNLRDLTARFPLGRFSVITGVSGAGKSTLAEEVLGANLSRLLAREGGRTAVPPQPVGCAGIRGCAPLTKLVSVGQATRTRSPRSNLLTFTGVYGLVRELYAATPLARARGYTASRFSFNTKGGRCEACKGEGSLRFEMSFLPDVTVPCEACGGKRFNPETLDIHWAGRSIADLLACTVAEALEIFRAVPALERQFHVLNELGLGYLTLGQPVSTLSGGEAQRLLLASELARPTQRPTLYLLDEPSAGQHPADVRLLLEALTRLRDAGHTIIAVDHNPYVIRAADWIVDLGPGGGDAGGRLLAEGTPGEVARAASSFTAAVLR